MPAIVAITFDRPSSCFCSGVLSVSVPASISAMWPISVPIPVEVTIISPRPRVTDVFMYAMPMRSPSGTSAPGTGCGDLLTGRLSPVSAASSISSVAATQTRPSAGTRLPASISTTSPGTRPSASISMAWPSRRTRAIVLSIFASAFTLSSAFASCRRPITALKTVSPASTTAVGTSWVTIRLIAAAASRTICMKSRYWRRNACRPDSFFPSARRFEPWDCNRRSASSALSPRSSLTPSRCATASASDECQSGPVSEVASAAAGVCRATFTLHLHDRGKAGVRSRDKLPRASESRRSPARTRGAYLRCIRTVIVRFGPLRSRHPPRMIWWLSRSGR